jgi:hypothetical protein
MKAKICYGVSGDKDFIDDLALQVDFVEGENVDRIYDAVDQWGTNKRKSLGIVGIAWHKLIVFSVQEVCPDCNGEGGNCEECNGKGVLQLKAA